MEQWSQGHVCAARLPKARQGSFPRSPLHPSQMPTAHRRSLLWQLLQQPLPARTFHPDLLRLHISRRIPTDPQTLWGLHYPPPTSPQPPSWSWGIAEHTHQDPAVQPPRTHPLAAPLRMMSHQGAAGVLRCLPGSFHRPGKPPRGSPGVRGPGSIACQPSQGAASFQEQGSLLRFASQEGTSTSACRRPRRMEPRGQLAMQ